MLSNAPDGAGGEKTFEVTHPFHPLHGREFELIDYRHNWGEDHVYFSDATGLVRRLPARWTSVWAQDPFVAAAAGRSPLRVADLGELADLIARLQSHETSSAQPGDVRTA